MVASRPAVLEKHLPCVNLLTRCCSPRRDPYAGEVAHCLDAISRWYACDIERFGYLMQ